MVIFNSPSSCPLPVAAAAASAVRPWASTASAVAEAARSRCATAQLPARAAATKGDMLDLELRFSWDLVEINEISWGFNWRLLSATRICFFPSLSLSISISIFLSLSLHRHLSRLPTRIWWVLFSEDQCHKQLPWPGMVCATNKNGYFGYGSLLGSSFILCGTAGSEGDPTQNATVTLMTCKGGNMGNGEHCQIL